MWDCCGIVVGLTKIKSEYGFRSIIENNQVELFKKLTMMQILKERFEIQAYESLQYRILKIQHRHLKERHQKLRNRLKHVMQDQAQMQQKIKRRLTEILYFKLHSNNYHVKAELSRLGHIVQRYSCSVSRKICHPNDSVYLISPIHLPESFQFFSKTSVQRLPKYFLHDMQISQKFLRDVEPFELIKQFKTLIDELCMIKKTWVDQLSFEYKTQLETFVTFIISYSMELNDPRFDIYFLKKLAVWGDTRAISICNHQLLVGQNGKCYIGDLKFRRLHGSGVLRLGKLYKYSGQFQKGKLHGRGVLMFCDGRFYDGEFQFGKYHGKGVFSYPDGRRLMGQFMYGLPTDQCVLINQAGHSIPINHYVNNNL